MVQSVVQRKTANTVNPEPLIGDRVRRNMRLSPDDIMTGLGCGASFQCLIFQRIYYIQRFSLRLSRSPDPDLTGIKQACRNTVLPALNYFNKINIL